MPYGDFAEKDIASSNYSNQADPFFVSSKGRYIWSDKPFKFSAKNGELTIISDFAELKPVEAGKTLKEAFLAAAKNISRRREPFLRRFSFPRPSTTLG